jgi:hypothetical protein
MQGRIREMEEAKAINVLSEQKGDFHQINGLK